MNKWWLAALFTRVPFFYLGCDSLEHRFGLGIIESNLIVMFFLVSHELILELEARGKT